MKTKILALALIISLKCFPQATGMNLGPFTTNTVIGTAAGTFETNPLLNISQTISGITLTLPQPTNVNANKDIAINNKGTIPFVITTTLSAGSTLYPKQSIIYRWNGVAWTVAGSGITTGTITPGMILAPPISGGYASWRAMDVSDVPTLPYMAIADTVPSGKIMTKYNATNSINGIYSAMSAKQNSFNGTGFIIMTGTLVAYDPTAYYPASNPSGYISSYTETDPVWTAASSNYYTKTQADGRYLQSFTEIDPVFIASASFGISGTNITNWNAVYAASSGYATASNAIAFTNKTGNVSMWTNDSGYLTSVPAQTFASLTGKPTTISDYGITDPIVYTSGSYANPSWITSFAQSKVSYTGTSGQYVDGTGALTTFPTIPSATASTTINAGSNITIAGNNPFTIGWVPTVTTFTNVIRPINSGTYTISSKEAQVFYNIRISCTATIGGASSGSILLQYTTNGGGVWNDLQSIENSNTVTLAIILNSVTIQTSTIVAIIPAGAICRMVPSSAGTTTITYLRGQEKY